MPLPAPRLDDRRFQDIVDQAKSLIPQYCPEWTDHNVSDPGVALIELFAWMTDLLLYRVNQVPDKMYTSFLELIGVRLDPPRAARAPVTFHLSAAQSGDVVIPEDTEVATIRTETSPAIVFSTERSATIRRPMLAGAFTRDIQRRGEGEWVEHDLGQIDLPGRGIPVFSPQPEPGDAFYLAFQADMSKHVLALIVDCQNAHGVGVDPTRPPMVWEVWQGGGDRWAKCDVEFDGTGGFNWSGETVLHLPTMAQVTFRDVEAYWLRCRMIEPVVGKETYEESPVIDRLRIESRGITIAARHAVTVTNEMLGRSDGTPGQVLRLLGAPLLARDPARDRLIVLPQGGEPQIWQEVADFGDSGPDDRHYVLDATDGTVTLGPALLQPDGSVYRFGAIPDKAGVLTFSRYQRGGGVTGNVPKGMILVLKSSIPYIARVVNRESAIGGRDAQSIDDAKLRAPQMLRTRTRAVTADDFEVLARQVTGVERAKCVAPWAQPGASGEPAPGRILLAVLPQVDDPAGYIAPERLTLSAELKRSVEAFLNERRLLGTTLEVVPPKLMWVSINARVRLPEQGTTAMQIETRRRAEAALYRYLNPYTGGPEGTGWAFGRDLHVSELYALLQRIPGIEFVDELRISVRDPGSGSTPQDVSPRLVLPPEGLVCSDAHRVNRD
ncbi:MAG: putative baseplate assembly protein [Gemmatimonadaceae bacterium]